MTWLESLVPGRGERRDRATLEGWNRAYRAGAWERLRELSEVAHLAVLAGYFRRLTPNGSRFLDVGCGEGLLYPHVVDHAGRYLGVDDAAAVHLAIERRHVTSHEAPFRVADMNAYSPTEVFDAVCFCESIYYLHDFDTGLRRYTDALTPHGVLLVSIHARRKHNYCWRELDQSCETLDAVFVKNANGVGWNVRALRPKALLSVTVRS